MTKYKNASDEVLEVKKIFENGLEDLYNRKQIKAERAEIERAIEK